MKKYLITASAGWGNYKLTSFDDALRNSDIGNYNLVKVSSILPVATQRVNKVDIEEGSVLYTAFSSLSSNISGERISAAVAVGISEDSEEIGVIMELSDKLDKLQIEDTIKSMVIESMEARGYKIKEIIIKSQTVVSDGKGYATAFAALAMW